MGRARPAPRRASRLGTPGLDRGTGPRGSVTVGADHDDEPAGLSAFQRELTTLFFALPAASGFLLAGGAALIAQRLINRPTRDLDFFTTTGADVPLGRAQLEHAAAARGWTVEHIHENETFSRMVVHGPEDVLIDLAMDSSPAARPASVSIAGPTYSVEELAGRKVLALFDRAEARDFADVYILAQRYTKQELLTFASDIDAGFNHIRSGVFSRSLGCRGHCCPGHGCAMLSG
jgi:hypothetical protein